VPLYGIPGRKASLAARGASRPLVGPQRCRDGPGRTGQHLLRRRRPAAPNIARKPGVECELGHETSSRARYDRGRSPVAGGRPLGAQPLEKKLIEYGWDCPTPTSIAANIDKMPGPTFDGVIYQIPGIRDVFSVKTVDEAALAKEREALKTIHWGRYTDNFVVMLAASQMDWFLRRGLAVGAAQRAPECQHGQARGARGVCFDCEPYGDSPWDYSKQKSARDHTFPEFEAKVRERGRAVHARGRGRAPGAGCAHVLSAGDV